MKKLFYFIALALFSVSCMTEMQDEVVSNKTTASLKVSMGGADTKIQLNDELKTVWNKGDQVTVYYHTATYNSELWTFQGEDGDRTGTITGPIDENASDIDEIVIAYPGSDWGYYLDSEAKLLEAELPGTQQYLAGSYDPAANVMVAVGTGGEFQLQNVLGWLKLNLVGNGIVNRIELVGNAGETLSGDIMINYETLEVEPMDGGYNAEAAKTVILECPDGVQLDPTTPTPFYLAVIPGTFAEGFKVNVSGNGEFHQQSTTKKVVIERNVITPLASFEYNKYEGASTVDVEEVESKRTAYDNYITITVKGYESYYALPVFYGESVEERKVEMIDGLSYTYGRLGKHMTENYEGSLYQLDDSEKNVVPGTTGTLLILPMDGSPYSDYTVADIWEFSFTTTALATGGSVDASAEQVFTHETWQGETAIDPYTGLGVEVSAGSGTWKYFYFAWVTEEDYNANKDNLVEFVVKTLATYPISSANLDPVIVNTDLAPGSIRYFVGFFVDNNDKYGEIVAKKLATDKVAGVDIDANVTTNLVNGILKNSTALEVTVKAEGVELSKIKYICVENDEYNEFKKMTPEELAGDIHLGTVSSYSYYQEVAAADLVDGMFVLDDHEYGTSYYLALLPYDADGTPANSAEIIEYDVVYELDEVITDKAKFVSEPTVTFTIPEKKEGSYGEAYYWLEGTSSRYSLEYTVAPVEGTTVVSCIVSPECLTGYDHSITDTQKASSLWAGNIPSSTWYIYKTTEETTFDPRTFYDYESVNPITAYILVSWTDADGKYYYKEVDLSADCQTMFDNLHK